MSQGHEEFGTDSFKKMVGVVPTLYYDLIARIIPGTAFIVALSWEHPRLFIQVGEAGKLILLIGAGYLAGMLLTGASLVLDLIWWLVSLATRKKRWKLIGPYRIAQEIDGVMRTNVAAGDNLFSL